MTRVRFVTRAAKQVREAEQWWRANRPEATNLFAEEVAAVVALLAGSPQIGSPYEPRPGVRRVLLRRTLYWVYYVYDPVRDEVRVRALWHSTRGRTPPLK